MKYEFHVGDYVETKDGEVGYITTLENLPIGWDIRVQLSIEIQEFIITEISIPIYFKRIGRYSFTKINKIKPLINDSPYSAGQMWAKINELVEAVNRLEDKVN